MQSVNEGSVRFEHCYRLDLDENIGSQHRKACWDEWSRRYTYGQSRDRIEYARRRLRSLAMGDPQRPRLNIELEHRPEERQFYLSVPAPTSAHAPPPPIATRHYDRSGSPPDSSPRAPGDTCADSCRTDRARCLVDCVADAGTDASAPDGGAECPQCDADYKRCMGRCFR
jgi:hypothetical protein